MSKVSSDKKTSEKIIYKNNSFEESTGDTVSSFVTLFTGILTSDCCLSGPVQFSASDAPHRRSQRDHREQPHWQPGGGGGAAPRHPPVLRPARHRHHHADPHLQEEEGLGGHSCWQ